MSEWRVLFTRHAQKDAKKISASGLRPKVEYLVGILKGDPFQSPPRFEKLIGDLSGAHSRRINVQHRLVHQVYEQERIVKVIRMWTHYDCVVRVPKSSYGWKDPPSQYVAPEGD